MTVAVVAPGYGNDWNERDILTRKLAGALANSADVDVLLPGGVNPRSGNDGAMRLLQFPSTPVDPARRRAWRWAMLGDRADDEAFECTCLVGRRHSKRKLPALAQEELVRAEGGDSPLLYEHLRQAAYDVIVFVGYHSAAACWGSRAVPDRRRVVLVPGMCDPRTLWLAIHDHVFDRADRIIVSSDYERRSVADRIGGGAQERVENVGFVSGINTLARSSDPHDFDCRGRYIVLAGDWTRARRLDRVKRWAERFTEIDPDLRLRFVGPGAAHLDLGIRLTSSRLDVWRWVSRAVCLLDPQPHRILGREVLEAMLYGTPVVVHARGGATQEHAERGNSGLWYRTDEELFAVMDRLLDEDLGRTLGEQGRSYAEANFTDTHTYIKTVSEAVLA